MTKSKMLGRSTAIGYGPGGGHCPCCGDAPGRRRKEARRRAKRSERNAWRKEARR